MRTIYLDMDGVVADFDAYALAVLGAKQAQIRWSDAQWNSLRNNPRMFRDLNKTPEADQLVEVCRLISKQKGYNLLFLTAIPHDNDMPWSFYDKVCWAQQRYPDIPVHFGPYSKDKHLHAKPGDILIDDRASNIREWMEAGGVAILHRGDLDSTLRELQNITK